jgi:hypothetical protein
MNQQVDSKTLFVKQVQSHSQSLCDLLGCDTTAAAPPNVIERCAVSTRMLAGTSSLMGLMAWEQILAVFEDLLVRYNETGMPWDERIAQVTSEIIEREESLVAAHGADPSVEIESIVGTEELNALREETAALLETIMTAEPPPPAAPPQPPPAQPVDVAQFAEPALAPAPQEAAPQPQAPAPPMPGAAAPPDLAVDPLPAGVPMSGVLNELKQVFRMLMGELSTGAFQEREWSSIDLVGIRNHLYFLDFYACSIEQMIDRQSPASTVLTCDLTPLKTAMIDFANETTNTGERAFDIVLTGEDTRIDPRLLPIAGAILQRMITDVYNRSEGEALGITINVRNNQGALHWQLTDNGDNFISDSQLDHEDQLAFYPGLKDVRKMLGRHHGVLWVESRDDREIRFEFTIPVSKASDSFMVWGEDSRTFGVRSVQLCDVMEAAAAPRGEDSYGEFLTIDNKRVPLLNLDVHGRGDRVTRKARRFLRARCGRHC